MTTPKDPQPTRSKSEYKRLSALGIEVTQPNQGEGERPKILKAPDQMHARLDSDWTQGVDPWEYIEYLIHELAARSPASHPQELVEAAQDTISKIEDAAAGKINWRADFADRLREALSTYSSKQEQS